MKNIKTIKKLPIEIASKLASNKNLVGLLVDDSKTPQPATKALATLLNDGYISIYPPSVMGELKNFNKNTFLTISVDNIQDSGYNIEVSMSVFVVTDIEHMVINDYNSRLLECVDNICTTLDQIKFSAAGMCRVIGVNSIIADKTSSGYRVTLKISDQQLTEVDL